MGGGLCVGFVVHETHWTVSVVLALLFGSAFLVFGLYLLIMSLFASHAKIARLFERIIGGI
jgi:hypothetical protein